MWNCCLLFLKFFLFSSAFSLLWTAYPWKIPWSCPQLILFEQLYWDVIHMSKNSIKYTIQCFLFSIHLCEYTKNHWAVVFWKNTELCLCLNYFSVCFILDSLFWCFQIHHFFYSFTICNLQVVSSSMFFISDIVLFISGSLIWVFYIPSLSLLSFLNMEKNYNDYFNKLVCYF